MSHDPATGINNPGAPSTGGQIEGAGGLAPAELRAQLLNEFMEKCGLYRRMLSMAFEDKSVTKRVYDLYSFIVFNVRLSKHGYDVYDASNNPPEHIIQELTKYLPSVTAERIRAYAREFNDFKARSARRVIDVCRKLERKKLRRFNAVTAEAINDIYKLAARESRENVRFHLELKAERLAETRVKEFLEILVFGYSSFPDELIPVLANIERRIFEGIDRGLLAETMVEELKRIAREELKVKRNEAQLLASLLLTPPSE